MSSHTTSAQTSLIPEFRNTVTKGWLRRVTIPVAATAFLALCAHISLPLPFTPVPVTMQTFAVLMIGLLFSPSEAFFTMVLYLAEGASGLPVFSPHGPGGFAQLSGTAAGYLLAYPFCACLVGPIFRRLRVVTPAFLSILGASMFTDALILLSGAAWLANLLHRTPQQAFALGVAPFFAGEACKLLLLAVTVTSLQHARPSR